MAPAMARTWSSGVAATFHGELAGPPMGGPAATPHGRSRDIPTTFQRPVMASAGELQDTGGDRELPGPPRAEMVAILKIVKNSLNR